MNNGLIFTPEVKEGDWEISFDEKFELESEGCFECGGFELIDKTMEKYPKGTYHCEYDLDKIKLFIRQLIAKEKGELVKKIVSVCD